MDINFGVYGNFLHLNEITSVAGGSFLNTGPAYLEIQIIRLEAGQAVVLVCLPSS